MKTRDEFIKSVREKSAIAMAEKEAARAGKKIKQKRIIRWSAAAAACLVIAVSAGSIGNVGSMFNTGTDGFMPEQNGADGSDAAGTINVTDMDGTASTAERGGASATDSYSSESKNLYMLPAGIVLEDIVNDSRTEINGEGVAEYMDWFYNLPDEMKLTTEEYEEECEKSEPERTVRYRFTMDLSLGEDKEGVDRIFYIVDGVELP